MYFSIQSDNPRVTWNAFKKVKFSIYLLNYHQDMNKVKVSWIKFYLCPDDDLVN